MHAYVELAKEAIREYLSGRKRIPEPEPLPEDFRPKAGVFVSLKKRGELRGCIGTFMPTTDNLHQEIARNAVAAAVQDPRFQPVRIDELDELSYSVDVLSEPEKINDLSQLDPKIYGVIVSTGFQRGLLLPDLEGVDTVEEQLRIARMKAGISPHDESVELYRFTVTRYR